MKKMKERIEAKKEARMEELREELRQEKETKKETEEMKNEENKISESPIEDNEAKAEETENKEAETEASENEEKEEMVENGVHNYSAEESYVWPTDPKVRRKLEWFRDQKLGLMMHWGAYSQLGIVESWALSDADACWSRHCIDWEVTGEEFKKQYFDLNKTFNPIRFEPEKWADIAKAAGTKYLLFTTKHHDGFCMWDSKYSNYKVTAPDCPYHTNHYADICAHLFESFRKRDLGVIAYFSKADWHVDSYWSENYAWKPLWTD